MVKPSRDGFPCVVFSRHIVHRTRVDEVLRISQAVALPLYFCSLLLLLSLVPVLLLLLVLLPVQHPKANFRSNHRCVPCVFVASPPNRSPTLGSG